MKEFELKYGINPDQGNAKLYMKGGEELPFKILNGRPGYINFLDCFNSWQLARELKEATGVPAAASFKHVSPAGAAIGLPLSDILRDIYHIDPNTELSQVACAYVRARGTDRMSSFGDWIALSDECDESCAEIIKHEVSDGIVAPSYSAKALEILKSKKGGNYNIIEIDEGYKPRCLECRDVFGVTFQQAAQTFSLNPENIFNNIVTKNREVSNDVKRDLLISLIVLKYTQSNSVCYVKDGQTIGVGAGQQSRIHCTRLAGDKADLWHLRQHEKVLSLPFRSDITKPNVDNAIDVYLGNHPEDVAGSTNWADTFTCQPEMLSKEEQGEYLRGISGVSLGSDAFFPFGDNVERARRSGVTSIVQPGGSIRDDQVIETCDKYGILMAFCGTRLFHH